MIFGNFLEEKYSIKCFGKLRTYLADMVPADWVAVTEKGKISFHWFTSQKMFSTVKLVNSHWSNQLEKYIAMLNLLIFT